MIAVILVTVIAGLIVNELTDLCPWLAVKLVRWSAHKRYTDPNRAETRAEELAALIKDRPGSLLKLCTALGFAASALIPRASARYAAESEPSLWELLSLVTRSFNLPGISFVHRRLAAAIKFAYDFGDLDNNNPRSRSKALLSIVLLWLLCAVAFMVAVPIVIRHNKYRRELRSEIYSYPYVGTGRRSRTAPADRDGRREPRL